MFFGTLQGPRTSLDELKALRELKQLKELKEHLGNALNVKYRKTTFLKDINFLGVS